jgi:hypothetical protein
MSRGTMALLHGLIDLEVAIIGELKRWEIDQARGASVEIYINRWTAENACFRRDIPGKRSDKRWVARFSSDAARSLAPRLCL